MIFRTLIIVVGFLFTSLAPAADRNIAVESFSKAKKMLLNDVYSQLPKKTIYCDADFNSKGQITNANGFESDKYIKRQPKIEWEHVVPAENFGRIFSEWRDGHPECVSSKGKAFKGRNCASKVNKEYRLMQSDMYNLYPAIGAVNALRSNYNFTPLNDVSKQLGKCEMQIDSKSRKAEPPNYAKGMVARSYLYMESAYPRYRMSDSQRKLMNAWDKQYPVTKSECHRAKLIQGLQGNRNLVISTRCIW